MKDFFKSFSVGMTFFVILLAIVLILGATGVIYKSTIGKASVDVDREIFEHSQSHIQGMTDDLAKYKYELSSEKDSTARKALVELIIDRFSTLDTADIEDQSLAQFLTDVRNGQYNEEN